MNKPLYHFFTKDHNRIGRLLDKAAANPGGLETNYYHQFRKGLLKHIKMEEKVLFPATQKQMAKFHFHWLQSYAGITLH